MKKKPIPHTAIFFRKPQSGNISIERLFDYIIKEFPADSTYKIFISTFISRGVFKRLFNIFEAYFRRNDVNHITGDVHFLSYLLPKNKTILTIHDCAVLERLHGIKKYIFYFFWFWLPEKRVSIITVISESTKKEVLRYIKCDEKKIRVIHDCISKEFNPVPKVFDSKMPIILQIGTGDNKNIINVAKALSGITCHLRIIGRLSEQQIIQLTKSNINYTNSFNLSDADIVNEYIKCDVLIFASTYEGFGMPILEANATGRPVLTSNILSMPEVAGNAACLVNPFDIDDIRRGILKILSDELFRGQLVTNGYINAKRFNPKNISNQYINLYKEIHQNNNT